jgi:hypothetical protein
MSMQALVAYACRQRAAKTQKMACSPGPVANFVWLATVCALTPASLLIQKAWIRHSIPQASDKMPLAVPCSNYGIAKLTGWRGRGGARGTLGSGVAAYTAHYRVYCVHCTVCLQATLCCPLWHCLTELEPTRPLRCLELPLNSSATKPVTMATARRPPLPVCQTGETPVNLPTAEGKTLSVGPGSDQEPCPAAAP